MCQACRTPHGFSITCESSCTDNSCQLHLVATNVKMQVAVVNSLQSLQHSMHVMKAEAAGDSHNQSCKARLHHDCLVRTTNRPYDRCSIVLQAVKDFWPTLALHTSCRKAYVIAAKDAADCTPAILLWCMPELESSS